MKKHIIIALLAIAIFPACKKDKNKCEACKPASELIKGTWTVTSARSEYFNAANAATPDAVVQQTLNYKYVITADKIRRVNTTTNNVYFDNPYTLNSLNGKNNTISFAGEAGVENYEIVSITNDRMQLQQVKTDQEYTIIGDTQKKKAAKQVIIIDFKKATE
jgi:Lipocalin-like domain